MKRLFSRTMAALAAVLVLTIPARAISAQKAILLDAQTGRVLYEKDADSRSLIASTTKIMTALVVCRRCNVLDRVQIPKEAVGIEGSSMYLREGEILTVQEAAGFQLNFAKWDEEFIRLWNTPCHTPAYSKE